MMAAILRIDSSARLAGSFGRTLTDKVVEQLQNANSGASLIIRDVAQNSIPHVDASWLAANYTPADDRTEANQQALAQSDALIAELQSSDIIVIGCPIYNFSVPASLKAWIDQICRAGVTFRYSPEGPVGLLEGKRAIIIITSGGTEMDSNVDFATGYLRHVLGFIGITDVSVIASDRLMVDEAIATARAQAQVAAL
jgi:FMN-dependent NADH-azoreductase